MNRGRRRRNTPLGWMMTAVTALALGGCGGPQIAGWQKPGAGPAEQMRDAYACQQYTRAAVDSMTVSPLDTRDFQIGCMRAHGWTPVYAPGS